MINFRVLINVYFTVMTPRVPELNDPRLHVFGVPVSAFYSFPVSSLDVGHFSLLSV